MTARPGVFLDRDGTIIRDTAYIRDPDDVALLPGVASAIRKLNERPLPVIVVTNQSGIARGLLTEQDFERTRMRLEKLLAAEGARVDATYHCPHHPDFSGPCDCRKPGPKLYRQAAAEHGLDLAASFYVGDRQRDVAPSAILGGKGILILSESTPSDERAALPAIDVVDSLPAAVAVILRT